MKRSRRYHESLEDFIPQEDVENFCNTFWEFDRIPQTSVQVNIHLAAAQIGSTGVFTHEDFARYFGY